MKKSRLLEISKAPIRQQLAVTMRLIQRIPISNKAFKEKLNKFLGQYVQRFIETEDFSGSEEIEDASQAFNLESMQYSEPDVVLAARKTLDITQLIIDILNSGKSKLEAILIEAKSRIKKIIDEVVDFFESVNGTTTSPINSLFMDISKLEVVNENVLGSTFPINSRFGDSQKSQQVFAETILQTISDTKHTLNQTWKFCYSLYLSLTKGLAAIPICLIVGLLVCMFLKNLGINAIVTTAFVVSIGSLPFFVVAIATYLQIPSANQPTSE